MSNILCRNFKKRKRKTVKKMELHSFKIKLQKIKNNDNKRNGF